MYILIQNVAFTTDEVGGEGEEGSGEDFKHISFKGGDN